MTHSLTLLGKLPDSRSPDALSNAIVRIEKTALSSDSIESVWAALNEIKFVEHTDIVSSKMHILSHSRIERVALHDSTAGYSLGSSRALTVQM